MTIDRESQIYWSWQALDGVVINQIDESLRWNWRVVDGAIFFKADNKKTENFPLPDSVIREIARGRKLPTEAEWEEMGREEERSLRRAYSRMKKNPGYGNVGDVELKDNPSSNWLWLGIAAAAGAVFLFTRKTKAKALPQAPEPFEPAGPLPTAPAPVSSPAPSPAAPSPKTSALLCTDPSVVLIEHKLTDNPTPQYRAIRSLSRWNKVDLAPSQRTEEGYFPITWSSDQILTEGSFGNDLQQALFSYEYFYSVELWIMTSGGWCLRSSQRNYQ